MPQHFRPSLKVEKALTVTHSTHSKTSVLATFVCHRYYLQCKVNKYQNQDVSLFLHVLMWRWPTEAELSFHLSSLWGRSGTWPEGCYTGWILSHLDKIETSSGSLIYFLVLTDSRLWSLTRRASLMIGNLILLGGRATWGLALLCTKGIQVTLHHYLLTYDWHNFFKFSGLG